MIRYFIAAILVLSFAFTSGGILMVSHLRSSYKSLFLSSLLFFEVFWFTFGFYAIWGQIIVSSFLKDTVETEILTRIMNILVILGFPFLVFAWFMLVKMAAETGEKKMSTGTAVLIPAITIFFVPGAGYLLSDRLNIDTNTLVVYGFIVLNIMYTVAVSVILMNAGNKNLKYSDRRNISAVILVLMIIQNSLLVFYDPSFHSNLLFILFFYLTGAVIPVYLRYRADLSGLLIPETNQSFDSFCAEYQISKREKEIIHEICNGFSNQQIADRLYISLQTVKDHTHRIYIKTGCQNRAQLIKMVNEGR